MTSLISPDFNNPNNSILAAFAALISSSSFCCWTTGIRSDGRRVVVVVLVLFILLLSLLRTLCFFYVCICSSLRFLLLVHAGNKMYVTHKHDCFNQYSLFVRSVCDKVAKMCLLFAVTVVVM